MRGFRYRVYPTEDQEKLLRATLGCVRFVYNKGLSERTRSWLLENKSVGYPEQSKQLTNWKKLPELHFLTEVSAPSLQQSLRDLQVAFSRFFSGLSEYPRFKRRKSGGSASFPRTAFRLVGDKLYLAKMADPIRVRWSRPLPVGAAPSSVRVSLDCSGRWHVSMVCDDRTIRKLPPSSGCVGIDLGIRSFATLSSGEKLPAVSVSEHDKKRIALLHKRLSRKARGSSNAEKARIRLARAISRERNRRSDHHHKLSTRLVRENQVISVESLNVSGMVRSSNLSRKILDSGWSSFVAMLRYKSEWYGRELIEVDRFFPSSKTCSSCGWVNGDLSRSAYEWTCVMCGSVHDRDHNAAKNILAAGHAVAACGPCVSRQVSALDGKKQESPSHHEG